MTATETFLGQIFIKGEWLDYARGTEQSARDWQAEDPTKRRVVDWIRKDRIIVPETTDPEGVLTDPDTTWLEGTVTETEPNPGQVELDHIISEAQAAKAALADEHEGNYRAAVERLSAAVTDLHTTVRNW